MIPSDQLLSPAHYQRTLRPSLPKKAFARSPRKLFHIGAHLLVIFCGYLAVRYSGHWAPRILSGLIIGHSLACIAFLAHELSHHTIVSNRRLRYVLESLVWGLLLIPPTVWRRVHNHTHHHHTNTPDDPDRQFLESEDSSSVRWYTRLFYPSRHSLRWNILVALHFVPYVIRNTVAAFYPGNAKPGMVPAKPTYKPRERLAVAVELCCIFILQTLVFQLAGGTWGTFFFASILAVLAASAVVMAYVFTNHFLNPICETNDPVASSTSVVVPQIFNRLHSNFSYHTEHHLFPSLNSMYYPEVSELLREHFGDRYHRIGICEAWKALWEAELQVQREGGGTESRCPADPPERSRHRHA